MASASFKGIQALLNHGRKRFILENPKEQIQCKRTLYCISLCKPVKINARITAKSANFFFKSMGHLFEVRCYFEGAGGGGEEDIKFFTISTSRWHLSLFQVY